MLTHTERLQDQIDRRTHIEAMPRVRFVCGRDWMRYSSYAIGVLWKRNLDAGEAEEVYQHRFVLHILFRFSFDRH